MTRRIGTGSSRALRRLCAPLLLSGVVAAMASACSPEERDFGQTSSSTGTGGAGGQGGGQVCTPMATEPCYTGPAGTEDTGLCKSGTHTCLEDGSGFGACAGEVLPQKEDCTTPADEACDGADSAAVCPPLGIVWNKLLTSPLAVQYVTDLAMTPEGDLIVTGYFAGTLDFGGQQLASTGSYDILLARLKPTGETVWAKRFGDASSQRAYGVTVAPSGAIYVVGAIGGSVDFGDGTIKTSTGADDAFVAKFDPTGSVVWSKLFGDANGAQIAMRVALNNTEQVIVAGNFTSAVNFGGGALSSAGGYDIFVVKLDSSGFHVTSRRFGGTTFDGVDGLAVDGTGSPIVTGSFDDSIDFGATTISSAGGRDVYVVKLSNVLTPAWAKRWGDNTAQFANDIAVDTANGDVVVTGSFAGGFDAGGTALKSLGASNLFAVRLSTNGDLVWANAYGDAASTSMFAKVEIVPGGTVMLGGNFNGSVDLGQGPVTPVSGLDAFLAKLDTGGKPVASKIIAGLSDQSITALSLGAQGEPYIGASFGEEIDLDGTVVMSSDPKGGDAVVARLLP